jgi:hypothetical protein
MVTLQEEWVICRIFHKTGEKKNPLFQGQSYFLEVASSSPTSGSLPPLLETPTTLLEHQSQNSMQNLQNPFLINQQENDLKSLINPVVSQSHHLFPMNEFQVHTFLSPIPNTITSTTTISTNKNTDTNNSPSPSPLPSMLFKSLLSHQECTFKEQVTIQKQCKTEGNFSHCQLPSEANLQWMDRIHPNTNQYQNPLLFQIDCGLFGVSAAASAPSTDLTVHEMSTSIAFNRAGFQQMLDPSMGIAGGESWPLDAKNHLF